MELRKISEDCFKVTATAEELGQAGVTFESFGEESVPTARFLGYVLSLLKMTGYSPDEKTRLSVKVFQQEDDGVVMYFIWGGKRISPTIYSVVSVVSDRPTEFFSIVPKVVQALGNKLVSAELYSIEGGYAVVFQMCCHGELLKEKLPDLKEKLVMGRIKNEKIREYGNLLSASPIDLFVGLSD